MRNSITLFFATLFAAMVLFPGVGCTQGLRVAYVDFQKFAAKSVRAQSLQKHFQTLVNQRRAELEKKGKEIVSLKEQLQKQGPMLKEETRNAKIKEIGIKEMEYKLAEKQAQTNLQNSQREQQEIFRRDIGKIIGNIRKQRKLDLIFDSAALLSASDVLDITDEVAKLYDAGAKAAGRTPAKPAARSKAPARPQPQKKR